LNWVPINDVRTLSRKCTRKDFEIVGKCFEFLYSVKQRAGAFSALEANSVLPRSPITARLSNVKGLNLSLSILLRIIHAVESKRASDPAG